MPDAQVASAALGLDDGLTADQRRVGQQRREPKGGAVFRRDKKAVFPDPSQAGSDGDCFMGKRRNMVRGKRYPVRRLSPRLISLVFQKLFSCQNNFI
jgi:hypothetical protein